MTDFEHTAFGLRREHFLMEIVAAWDPSGNEDGAVYRQWVCDLSSAHLRA